MEPVKLPELPPHNMILTVVDELLPNGTEKYPEVILECNVHAPVELV